MRRRDTAGPRRVARVHRPGQRRALRDVRGRMGHLLGVERIPQSGPGAVLRRRTAKISEIMARRDDRGRGGRRAVLRLRQRVRGLGRRARGEQARTVLVPLRLHRPEGAPDPRRRGRLRVRQLRARARLRDATGAADPMGSAGTYGLEQVSAGAVSLDAFAVRPNDWLPPTGTEPFQLALLTVACVPRLTEVSVPFQTLLMVVPLGIVQPTRQPLSAAVPGLRTVTCAW